MKTRIIAGIVAAAFIFTPLEISYLQGDCKFLTGFTQCGIGMAGGIYKEGPQNLRGEQKAQAVGMADDVEQDIKIAGNRGNINSRAAGAAAVGKPTISNLNHFFRILDNKMNADRLPFNEALPYILSYDSFKGQITEEQVRELLNIKQDSNQIYPTQRNLLTDASFLCSAVIKAVQENPSRSITTEYVLVELEASKTTSSPKVTIYSEDLNVNEFIGKILQLTGLSDVAPAAAQTARAVGAGERVAVMEQAVAQQQQTRTAQVAVPMGVLLLGDAKDLQELVNSKKEDYKERVDIHIEALSEQDVTPGIREGYDLIIKKTDVGYLFITGVDELVVAFSENIGSAIDREIESWL